MQRKSTSGTAKVNRSCKISDPSQLWKRYDNGTLENKEFQLSSTWSFIPQNNLTDTIGYIEDNSTKEVLQATSGNTGNLDKVTGGGQLWKKGYPNIEGYFTLKKSDFSRFLTAKDTENFTIQGEISIQ